MKYFDLTTIRRWKLPRSLVVMLILLPISIGTVAICKPQSYEKIQTFIQKSSVKAVYLGAGAGFKTMSFLARAGWLANLATREECLFLSSLSGSAAHHLLSYLHQDPSIGTSPSQESWHFNQHHLSQIPASTDEEKKLLLFLENRWLAKSTGFFSVLVDWTFPAFGISMQVHPESTSHYARNPWIKLSQTYQKRVDAWKKMLPHPEHFPLILTRPADLHDYLPSYLHIPCSEKTKTTAKKLAQKIKSANSKVVVDLTDVLRVKSWEAFQAGQTRLAKKNRLNLKKVIFVQRLSQEAIGGLRLLPMATSSRHKIRRDEQFLLKWISTCGLTANRIELDRCPPASTISHERPCAPIDDYSKKTFLSRLNSFNYTNTVMIQGTLNTLQGLMANIPSEKWDEINASSTKSSVVHLSFEKIKDELNLLEKDSSLSFFETACHLEQIHASLTSLLEVCSPYTPQDFPGIYRSLLTCIPADLKHLTTCSLHSAGMTSIAGIFKAAKKMAGGRLNVLYGENTYFECIHIAEKTSNAKPIMEASEDDFKEADLIIAQFNPALKRIDLKPTEYRVERIAEALRKSLSGRHGRPLTVAIDSTFDYIDSPRIGTLFDEFQKEIASGILNIISYRSGLKFDLFGMDNYCGAPFFMVHSPDLKWAPFDSLSTDPVLQADRLSLNWFCLAYQHAAPQLELYRKQIFDNTRALLDQVPARLFDKNSRYRIMPVDPDADIGFLDIKISGHLHQIKGPILAGACLNLGCLEGGHPVFYRPSVGFYHPNFTMLFSEDNTTIRLTLGLDPSQVEILARCFEKIDKLNN
ncbi:MAG: hypothetical protein ABSA17_07270 [Rhabdochlamydiaceae bacterium]